MSSTQRVFAAFLASLRKKRWFVNAKRPFAGPKAVLAYLSRYTHRVAISNRRLIAVDEHSVTFKVKNYRIEGLGRYTTMTLDVREFVLTAVGHNLRRVLAWLKLWLRLFLHALCCVLALAPLVKQAS
jgi:Putative transposase